MVNVFIVDEEISFPSSAFVFGVSDLVNMLTILVLNCKHIYAKKPDLKSNQRYRYTEARETPSSFAI